MSVESGAEEQVREARLGYARAVANALATLELAERRLERLDARVVTVRRDIGAAGYLEPPTAAALPERRSPAPAHLRLRLAFANALQALRVSA